MNKKLIIAQVVKEMSGFFKRHHEVESAPRWTCKECQFESNEFQRSHHRDCSHYDGYSFKEDGQHE